VSIIIEQMLKAYDGQPQTDKRNVVKEIMQEMVLCGLSRAGFFKKAVFYGGTALRIFYGLVRFSEDLDFSLKARDEDFDEETLDLDVTQSAAVSWTAMDKDELSQASPDFWIDEAFDLLRKVERVTSEK
jgi:predicted nucleotidyltransferase component of viral defense system